MYLSVFDLFKIGIGPSSSHTVGPMVAARRFLDELAAEPGTAAAISVSLHGSLAYTGTGHGTDRAVILGLIGEDPETVPLEEIEDKLAVVARTRSVAPPGHRRRTGWRAAIPR